MLLGVTGLTFLILIIKGSHRLKFSELSKTFGIKKKDKEKDDNKKSKKSKKRKSKKDLEKG